jgi:hypothetical protein
MKTLRLLGIILIFVSFKGKKSSSDEKNHETSKLEVLTQFINPEVLKLAFAGYSNIQDSIQQNEKFLAIVDFSKPSIEKRFFLIRLEDTTLIHIDYVSHGKYSGHLFADSFSNERHSLKTSLGFYRVSETYTGAHGLSIRLDGLDKGYNDNARDRAIVMHAAAYAEPSVISELGRLGKSFGCPALPSNGFAAIVEHIKENAILFHYYPDKNYLKNCVWLR